MNHFKTDPEYRLDTMTHKFLPCLMQLKLSSEDDQMYIYEIQRVWFLLLDKIERKDFESTVISCQDYVSVSATERSLSLEEFLQRLLEQPIGQHYHSVSINKHQLVERYDDAVRDLQNRYPTFFNNFSEQRASPNRTASSMQNDSCLGENVPERPFVNDPRGSSPMQQDDDQQESPSNS